MAVTIKDIARQAGVAHTTVSRALNNSPLISLETTRRVRMIASEMGYRPSAAARSLKTNRSLLLGVIIRNVDDPFFSEILQGIEEVAQANGYSLFMAASQRDMDRDQNIIQDMVERRVEGVVICSTTVSTAHSRQLSRFGVPIVVVNNQAAEEYRYSIYHDDTDGSRQVTRHLLGLGHRKIAYLGNSNAGRSTMDRLTGYKHEIETAGIPIAEEFIHHVPGGSPEHGIRGMEYFFGLKEPPTAIVCYNDMMAIGVLKALNAAGLRVPDKVSITGFDNIVFSGYTNPPLTTFDQPKRYIGAEAARLLLGLLENRASEEKTPKIRMLKGRLLIRASTAPPPGWNL